MTKFSKKVAKAVKHTHNCVVIGPYSDEISDLVETFNTVFILSDGVNELKGRNIVYRPDFDDIKLLPHIDAAFIDYAQLDKLSKIENLLQHNTLIAYINTGEFIHPMYAKFLNNKKYEITEIHKNYQVWKPKK